MLLNDAFQPTTGEVGFIELPLGDAAAALEAVFAPQIPVRPRAVEGGLSVMLNSLLPLNSIVPRRYLMVATRSRWTAYFDNGWRGTDSRVPVSKMAEQAKCLGVRAVANPARWEGRKRDVVWPAVMWTVYSPEADDVFKTLRSIEALNDGGRWTFEQAGAPFPFEDLSRYSAPRIPDRFPVDLLLDYLRHFDIELFDASFYSGPGVLLEATNPIHPRVKEYPTFAAARGGPPSLT